MVDVTDGLAPTPTRVFLTVAGDPALVTSDYSGNLGETKFTIYATNNFINSTAVYWRAVIGEGN
jgi:hypothetical protein